MRAIPLAFVILTFVRASEGQGLLVNPSFESGCSGNFATLGAGSTAIPGWTVIGEVDWICTLWQPGDRVRSVDLNGCFAGGVSQVFSTIPNQRYSVAFQLSGNPGNPWPVQGPAVKVMQVSAAGTSATFSFDTTGRSFSNMGWQTNFWSFVATSSNTTLAFQSLTSGCQGPAIDFVHVTAGFDFTIVQPHPAGPITFVDHGGTPGNSFANLVSVVPGAFPAGPMYGIQLVDAEVLAQIVFGLPFFGPLGPNGAWSTTLPPPVPSGLTVYMVSLEIAPGPMVSSVTSPMSFTVN